MDHDEDNKNMDDDEEVFEQKAILLSQHARSAIPRKRFDEVQEPAFGYDVEDQEK